MNIAMQKEFSKAKNVLHPNSRKSIAIAKRTKKILNRQKSKMAGLIKQNLVGEKMIWIQENMVPNVCPYTPELTARLLETYIARNDAEMEQINIKRSIGGKRIRQHASREDMLRMTKERELEEYNTCGIEIPDILNGPQCQMLRNWNGELRFMTNFKFRRFGKKDLNKALQKTKNARKAHGTEGMQTEVSEEPENSSEQVSSENTENVLNKSADSIENDQGMRSTTEVE